MLSRLVLVILHLLIATVAVTVEKSSDDRECVISVGTTDAVGGARALRKPGEVITIRAKPPAKGMRFDRWVGNTQVLADPLASETTLTMPQAGHPFAHVHVSAAYRATTPLPFVHPLFADHAVLQRDATIPVWGWAAAGEAVTVTLAGGMTQTVAGADGAWRVTLGKLPAGGPHTLVIAGTRTVTLTDLLIGDVWLCSGQSNMRGSGPSAEDVAGAELPLIRQFEHHPASECYDGGQPFATFEGHAVKWQACTPTLAKHWSRVAFHFGTALHRQHQVPIGLVTSAFDGSFIEAWMPEATLATLPEYQVDGRFRPAWNLSWGGGQTPFIRYNSHIAPLGTFAMRGVLWYQGESNANALTSLRYRDLLTLMIRDWRATLGQPELPFVVIQMHAFGALDQSRPPTNRRDTWCELQESQLSVARTVPRVGCAVTVDLGREQSLHPPDKKRISERAALVARKVAYDELVVVYGPLLRGSQNEGGRIRLSFDHAQGLTTRDGQPLRHIAIAGADRRFVWAQAVIEGDTLVVSSPAVPQPVAVRYAWGGAQQEANLVNSAALPAAAFRTDEWKDEASR